MKLLNIFLALSLILFTAEATRCPRYQFTVFSDTAKNPARLRRIVDNYRAALGGINNGNNPGPIAKGQRSIDWDAGIVPFNMPGNFFDKTVTRGALLKAKGGAFAVSNPASSPPDDDRFSSLISAAQSKQFKRFSLQRLFTPIKSNRVNVEFKIPATNDRAAVTGFGAVFTDVDLKRRTFMRYFTKDGCLIAKVEVPPLDKGLSFVGIIVQNPNKPGKLLPVISKVSIKLGTVTLEKFADQFHGPDNHQADLVVLDDFIYGEPQM